MENLGSQFIESVLSQRPNVRKTELQYRYESLNEEEAAELQGILNFPDNPRGASLLMRDFLGQTTEEEKIELRKHSQRKQFTPEVNDLFDKVEANDPDIEQVSMSQGKAIEVSVADTEKIIWTLGLSGCYGSIVLTEHEDGTRDCVLTHYPMTELSVNMSKLGDLIGASEKMKTAKTKRAVLFMPGEWTQDPETKKFEMKTKDQHAVDALTIAIQAKLGTDVEIKLEPYSTGALFGEKDRGTLVVYVPPSGKGDVRYQTWYSSGKLTKQQEE